LLLVLLQAKLIRENSFGMKSNGKMVTYTGVNVDRIRNGKIVETWQGGKFTGSILKASAIKKND